jgi:hypothetical protein
MWQQELEIYNAFDFLFFFRIFVPVLWKQKALSFYSVMKNTKIFHRIIFLGSIFLLGTIFILSNILVNNPSVYYWHKSHCSSRIIVRVRHLCVVEKF